MSEQGIEMHLDHVQAMLAKIGASDAQKSQIDGILKGALRRHEGGARDARRGASASSTSCCWRRASTAQRWKTLRAEQIKSTSTTASKRLVTAIEDAAEVLSPDQRAALAEEVRKHHGG